MNLLQECQNKEEIGRTPLKERKRQEPPGQTLHKHQTGIFYTVSN